MKNALKVVDREIIIDPSLVKISSGNLPLPSNMRFEYKEPGIISIKWDASVIGGNDQAMAIVHTTETGHATGPVYGNMRSTGEHNINVHTYPGTTLHVYLAFIADDRSRQSDSVYLGKHEFQIPSTILSDYL